MRRPLSAIRPLFAALVCLAAGASCAETAAVAEAQAAVQTAQAAAQAALEAIPLAVRSVADVFVSTNHPDWGKPSTVVVTPDYYVFVYPTPAADQKAGRTRMVVVERTTYAARLARLQQGQL